MRLILHILRKDVRHLWWEVLVTIGLLALISDLDMNRNDSIPSPIEGLLQLVLPAAWAYLIALAVQLEPLAGNRAFWLTRPYSRAALAIEKLLFAAICVQAPVLAAQCVIIAARGFSPADYPGTLAATQLAVFLLVVLPAMALASVTRNIPQFLAAAAVLGLSAAWLNALTDDARPWIRDDGVGMMKAFAPAVVLSLAGVSGQYRSRRTPAYRIVIGAGWMLSAFLFAYLPRQTAALAGCLINRVPVQLLLEANQSLALTRDSRGPMTPYQRFEAPLKISGIPAGSRVYFESIDFSLKTAQGSWSTPALPARKARMIDFVAAGIWAEPGRQVLSVFMPQTIGKQIPLGPVTLSGKSAARLYEPGGQGLISVEAATTSVPGVGRCAAGLQLNYNGGRMLKVICESPDSSPFGAEVQLVSADGARVWTQRLGDSGTPTNYPTRTWLSPIFRRQTFFHLMETDSDEPGSRWLVPQAVLPGARVVITGRRETGCTLVSYHLRDVMLER